MKQLYIFLFAFVFMFTNNTNAQDNQISFYHLGDYVQQTQDVSPVYIPKNSFSFNVVSLGIGLSNGFSYKDLLPISTTTTNTQGVKKSTLKYDVKSAIEASKGENNNLTQSLTINVLNLSFKRKHGSLSLFTNIKQTANWGMNKSGLLFLAEKLNSEGYIEDFTINDNVNLNAYAEAGIGFTQTFLNDKLAVGLRLKYLYGLANASTQEDASLKLVINDDNTITATSQNAVASTAGYSDDFDVSEIGAGTGFGLDIGASFEILKNLVVEVAVNDIGSIEWTENIKEFYIEDASHTLFGVNLREGQNEFEEILEDFKNEFNYGERKGKSYKTKLATNSYASVSYKLGKVNQFRATMYNNHQLKDQEPTYALGYNLALNRTTYGVMGVKNAEGDIDYGVNMATKLGPLQIYLATDNLNKILGKPEEIKAVNLRFGINLVFGYNKWIRKKEASKEAPKELPEETTDLKKIDTMVK